jgi:hypothetical protein
MRIVRRLGLTAAGLLAVLTLALTVVNTGTARPSLAHTCTATDRQFIQEARTTMAELGLWGGQYESGDARASEVVDEAQQAAKHIRVMAPTDPSLEQTRRLMIGMLTEYAKAVRIHARHGNAGPHMYRAYGLANYAHGVLSKAQPALAPRGCDLSLLL